VADRLLLQVPSDIREKDYKETSRDGLASEKPDIMDKERTGRGAAGMRERKKRSAEGENGSFVDRDTKETTESKMGGTVRLRQKSKKFRARWQTSVLQNNWERRGE